MVEESNLEKDFAEPVKEALEGVAAAAPGLADEALLYSQRWDAIANNKNQTPDFNLVEDTAKGLTRVLSQIKELNLDGDKKEAIEKATQAIEKSIETYQANLNAQIDNLRDASNQPNLDSVTKNLFASQLKHLTSGERVKDATKAVTELQETAQGLDPKPVVEKEKLPEKLFDNINAWNTIIANPMAGKDGDASDKLSRLANRIDKQIDKLKQDNILPESLDKNSLSALEDFRKSSQYMVEHNEPRLQHLIAEEKYTADPSQRRAKKQQHKELSAQLKNYEAAHESVVALIGPEPKGEAKAQREQRTPEEEQRFQKELEGQSAATASALGNRPNNARPYGATHGPGLIGDPFSNEPNQNNERPQLGVSGLDPAVQARKEAEKAAKEAAREKKANPPVDVESGAGAQTSSTSGGDNGQEDNQALAKAPGEEVAEELDDPSIQLAADRKVLEDKLITSMNLNEVKDASRKVDGASLENQGAHQIASAEVGKKQTNIQQAAQNDLASHQETLAKKSGAALPAGLDKAMLTALGQAQSLGITSATLASADVAGATHGHHGLAGASQGKTQEQGGGFAPGGGLPA